MGKVVCKTLISREELQAMCQRLGKEISRDYQGKEIVLIGVLRGAAVFLTDLMREIDLPLTIDFMSVSSYSGTSSTGVVKINKDLEQSIEDKHIIIVEDVVDSGLTLSHLKDLLETRNPASIALCSAFDKPNCRKVDVSVDYVGATLPDEFVVGYGLDYQQLYRNLPYVAVLGDDGKE